jgi:PAS domain S-box-containing protein
MSSMSPSAWLPASDLVEALMGIADPLQVLDENWCFRFINEQGARSSGRKPRELIGKKIWEVFPYLVGTRVWDFYHQVMQERTPVCFELQGPQKNDWFEISVSPVPNGIAAVWIDKHRVKAAKVARDVASQVAPVMAPQPVAVEELSFQLQENRQENLLLEQLIEDAPVGITYLAGPEHRVTIANPAILQFFSHRNELVGCLPEEVFPGRAEWLPALLDRVYRTGEPFRKVNSLLHLGPEGHKEDHFFTYSMTPVRDATGQVRGILGIALETTEEVRARQALEQANAALATSEERIKIAQEAAQIGVWEWNARTNQVWWSPQTYEIYSYPPGQPMTMETSLERVYPEDVDALYTKMLASIQSHDDFRFEYRIRLPERGLRWVEGFARILFGADGETQRMIGTVRDITVRKEMESTLRHSLERERAKAAEMAAIMDAVPALVLVSRDSDSRFIDGNRMAHDMLGLRQGANLSKAATQSYRILRNGQEIQPEDLPIQVAAARGIAFRKYDFSLVLEDGSQTDLIGNVTPLYDTTGNPAGAVAAFVDISGQKQASDELRRLNDEVEQRKAQQEKDLRRLENSIEVTNKVVSAKNAAEIIQIVIAAAAELTGARYGVYAQGLQGEKYQYWATYGESDPDSFPMSQKVIAQQSGMYQNLMQKKATFRTNQAELKRRPGRWNFSDGHPPLRGIMGVRLTGPDGEPDGLLIVAERAQGEFTSEDESALVHLTTLASLSLRQIQMREAVELATKATSRHVADDERNRQVLDALMEYAQEGIVFAEGANAQIRKVSRYGREILGDANEQMTTGQVAGEWRVFEKDGLHPLPANELPLLRAIRKGEVVINREMVQINAAGLPLLVTCNAGPIRDQSGEIVGAVAAWRDITELRQMQEALQRSEARLHLALSSMPVTLFTLDRNLRYTWIYNQSQGLREKIVLGKRSDELRGADDLAELVALQQSVIDSGGKVRKEIRLRGRRKWYRYIVTLEPILNNDGVVTGLSGVVWDVTREP